MNQFSRLEARLQRLIEEGTARLFSAQDTRSILASQLIEAMQADVSFNGSEELLAPGTYTILAHPEHAGGLRANTALMEELGAALKRAAEASGVSLAGEPVFHIAPQDGLAEGEFRVRASGLGENLSQTQGVEALASAAEGQIPAGAFLIVGGAQIFPLSQAIVNIGRKNDNHLVLENPQVSRRHAQLRAINGHYHFFDLGSTGGSRINNVETKSAVLLAGDVINLAGAVPLIYGEDTAEGPQQTQEIPSSSNGHNSR